MNETMAGDGLDLDGYVEEVRKHLADLPHDAREELTECLASDLAEQVEDRGSASLPAPAAYADELRAAAGLAPATRRPLLTPGWWLPAWDIAVAALPAWWVARAWVWVMALHLLVWGSAPDTYDVVLLPTSSAGAGFALWVVVAVVSIQIGRGRCWPGGAGRSPAALVALVALNAATLVGVVWVSERTMTTWDQRTFEIGQRAWGWSDDVDPDVITYQGEQACVLQVFDADGKQVPGGYVWDATGQRRLPMNTRNC